MNIGLFLPNIPKHRGGGFTFENEIHQSIYKFAENAGFTFVYFGWINNPFTDIPKHIRYIDLRRSFYQRLKTGVLHRIGSILGINKESRKKWMDSYITSKLKAENISFVWYPTHSVSFTNWPFIATVWDLQHRVQPYFPEVSLNGEWEKRENHFKSVLQKASFVITGAQAGKDEIVRYYQVDEQRVWIIPHPTPKFALEEIPSKVQIDVVLKKHDITKPFLFYPAQFWAHKNHFTLLKVLKNLKSQGYDFQLVFCGSDKGNLEFIKQKAKELEIAEDTLYLGFIELYELRCLYKSSIALTYASTFGPENLPPLEAMALECPVIVANVPGAEEQIGTNGILVEALDVEEWVIAIKEIFLNANSSNQLLKLVEAKEYVNANDGEAFISQFIGYCNEVSTLRSLWA